MTAPSSRVRFPRRRPSCRKENAPGTLTPNALAFKVVETLQSYENTSQNTPHRTFRRILHQPASQVRDTDREREPGRGPSKPARSTQYPLE